MKQAGNHNGSFWVRIVITAVIFSVSLYVILSKGFAGDVENWAFAAMGSATGYWFRDSSE